MRYRFEDVELDSSVFELSRGGEPVAVEPQVLDLLLMFVTNPDRMLAKAEILDVVWGDRFVSESALTSRIKSARRAIGDSGREQRLIRTIHGRGYRFVAEVTVVDEDRTESPGPPAPPDEEVTASPPPVATGERDTGFIGRADELAQVLRSSAQDSPYTAVLVGGEAGMGKSRLVQEAAEALRTTGYVVALGECLDVGDGSVPFVPVVAALRDVAHQFDRREVADAVTSSPELAVLLPDYGDPATRPTTVSLDDGSSLLQLFAAVSAMLSRLSASRPICLVIEDLHWIDPSSRDLFSFLTRSVVGSSVTLLATYRNDELPAGHPLRGFVAELLRSPRVVDVALEPFEPDELEALAASTLGHAPDQAELAELAERSGGNPFYASEVLAAMAVGDVAVRPGLRELILARVASVSEGTRELLRSASVAGRSVGDDLLQTVTGIGEDELVTGLREATVRRILELGDDGTVQFRHALIQEAVYADLVPRERQRIHSRFADAIASVEDDRPAGIDAIRAWHHRQAGELAQALEASIAAARSAAATLATRAALDHAGAALELWHGVPDAPARAGIEWLELLQWTAQLADAAGDYVRAAELQRSAVEETADSETDQKARATVQLARYLWTAGRSGDALVEYERAVAMVPAEPPTSARAVVLAGYGQQLMLMFHYDEAGPILEEAIEVARRTGDRLTEGHATNSLGTVIFHEGRLEEGEALLRQALAIATEEGNDSERVRAYVNLTSGLSEAGDLPAAIAVAKEGREVAADVGYATGLGFFVAGNLLEILNDMGRWDEADALNESLVVPKGALGRGWVLRLDVDRMLGRGDVDEANELISVGDFTDEAGHWSRTANVALARGDREAARAAVDTGLRAAGTVKDEFVLSILSIELRAGPAPFDDPSQADVDGVRDEVEELQRRFRVEIPADDRRSYRFKAIEAEAEGWLLAVTGEDPSEPWRRAIAHWEAGELRWSQVQALLRLAEALVPRDPDLARQVLADGRDLAVDLGAQRLADRAAELDDRLGACAG